MDRFSKLPDFIMHHIMSYLSAKEVAHIGSLSKRWKGLSESFPIFDFSDSYVHHFMGEDLAFEDLDPTLFEFSGESIERFFERIPKFINFVDASLSRFSDLNLRMQKFILMICVVVDVQLMSPVLEKWLQSAIECGVEELELDFLGTIDTEVIYTLPQIMFSAKSTNIIKLRGCKLEQPSNNITRLLSLKSLTLNEVCMQEETIQKLIGQCPLLEKISLKDCWGFKRFYVDAKANYKLKTIKIRTSLEYELRTIRIVAPTLQEFKLSYQLRQQIITIDMSGCPNLKQLRLYLVTFTYQEFHSLISNFRLLEVLDLDTCEVERITISSNILKCLFINDCYKLKAIDIDTPNLVSFIYKVNQIPEFSINAPCTWYVEFANKKNNDIKFDLDTSWFLKMKEFLEESNQIEFLTLKIWTAENSFSFEEFIQSSASLPCKVGTLHLRIDEPQSKYEAMLDGVFAICYPRIISIIKMEDYHNNFVEWLCEKLINKESNCCESHHVKCWRHYLKDFKIERFFPLFDCGESFHNIDNLKDVWPELQLQPGYLQIRLDWCFSFSN